MMLSQDRIALNRKMRLSLAASAPDLSFYIADDDYEIDENALSAVFAFNPDASTLLTVSSSNVWQQVGIATLQINQPKSLVIQADELNAWDIADLGMTAFKGWRSDDFKTEVHKFNVQRVPDDKYLRINLLIYWRSKRAS
ncbi:hypothetical protein [Sphingobium sp. Ant17]|uniref:hypothetical protein n=1 Tax=Sphingobium sp. Ant17 TaxID=1461752 RepID=UPI00044BFF0C|nr:hypothetical protein [Sphingobium sp. Ant17]EXS67974.1 hypothetical protein BF95_16425 [Sphingobium sp. Ant17]